MQTKLQYFIAAVLILFLFSSAAPAKTNKLFIDLSLISKHIGVDEDDDYNEINPGIGLSYFIADKWEMRGGYYNNSYARPTFYLTANYVPLSTNLKQFNLKLGLAAGFASGYKDGELLILGNDPILFSGIVPVLAPNISVLFSPLNTRIVIILLGNAVALQVSYAI